MKSKEFYEWINKFAPKALSDEYCVSCGAYDNSGLLVDAGKEVRKALFTLDLTDGAVERAIAEGVDVIVTHHPVIYAPIKRIDGKIAKCIGAGISVVSMHLNLDVAQGGIDESLALAINKACGGESVQGETLMHPLSQGGYGRVYEVPKKKAEGFIEALKKELGSEKVWLFGEKERFVSKVASFCGSGIDDGAIAFAKENGADAVVSADWKHHQILGVLEEGMVAVQLTHYASEAYGFKKYYEKISRTAKVVCSYYEDELLF